MHAISRSQSWFLTQNSTMTSSIRLISSANTPTGRTRSIMEASHSASILSCWAYLPNASSCRRTQNNRWSTKPGYGISYSNCSSKHLCNIRWITCVKLFLENPGRTSSAETSSRVGGLVPQPDCTQTEFSQRLSDWSMPMVLRLTP